MSAPTCPFKSHPMRPGLEEPPKTMQGLPNDHRGYPVPYFVDWLDAETPEFRAFDPEKFVACVKRRLCWTCGRPLWRENVFVIGPMCAINRVNSEPPNHRECAIYSARNCPFLSRPHMVRRTDGLPDDIKAAGVAIQRNPGAMCLWYTYSYKPFRVEADGRGANRGILFQLGKPFQVEWYAEGRKATRDEVMASIDSGLPLLYAANDKELTDELRDSGKLQIQSQLAEVMRLVPKR